MTPSSRKHVPLPDGRHLDVYESGPRDGNILLFHHGTPGSSIPFRAIEQAAHRLGLRFITSSRPGYGSSTRHPGRKVVDVVADMTAVLDAVGAERCFVAGWSGGGPHALACGARLADKVAAVLVIAGVAPFEADGLNFLDGMGEDNIVEFGLAQQGEVALRPWLEQEAASLREATPDGIIATMGSLLPPIDRSVLTDDFGADMASNFHEALREGVEGWQDDDMAFLQPWGFDLAEIVVPTILWQGSADLMVPYTHGQWLAERIPGVVAHLEEGEGHLSIGVGKIDRMLEELIASR